MYVTELFSPIPTGYSTEKEDNTVLKLSDLRNSRLSLEQLNRLRIMNDVRKLEHEQKLKTVATQYKPPVEAPPL